MKRILLLIGILVLCLSCIAYGEGAELTGSHEMYIETSYDGLIVTMSEVLNVALKPLDITAIVENNFKTDGGSLRYKFTALNLALTKKFTNDWEVSLGTRYAFIGSQKPPLSVYLIIARPW